LQLTAAPVRVAGNRRCDAQLLRVESIAVKRFRYRPLCIHGASKGIDDASAGRAVDHAGAIKAPALSWV